MNRCEKRVAVMAIYNPKVFRAGRRYAAGKVHLVLGNGAGTMCGLRRGTMAADPAKVSDDRCCDKCFPVSVAE